MGLVRVWCFLFCLRATDVSIMYLHPLLLGFELPQCLQVCLQTQKRFLPLRALNNSEKSLKHPAHQWFVSCKSPGWQNSLLLCLDFTLVWGWNPTTLEVVTVLGTCPYSPIHPDTCNYQISGQTSEEKEGPDPSDARIFLPPCLGTGRERCGWLQKNDVSTDVASCWA